MELPNSADIDEAARRLGLRLDAATLEEMREGVNSLVGNVRSLDREADYLPPVAYPRVPGYRPDAREDPLNAWFYKTEVSGAADGPLAGLSFAAKDNICVAGVPMMNGASSFESYVPEIDATIITRLLDAGATLKGKANCEYLCFSGYSDTNATGPTENPHRPGYSAGGSSSGSAALVAAGEVDFALGGDQGGSIRMPAHFCGVYGMKPTWGLVPYTGVFPIEQTLDHVGPMTNNVRDNARILEVIAGADGLDPRQSGASSARYSDALDISVEGLRIGIVSEGFGHKGGDPQVDDAVRAAGAHFAELGALVSTVSIPMHRLGDRIWSGIVLEGSLEMMMLGNAMGTNWKGLHLASLARQQSAWRTNPNELPMPIRIAMLAGEILRHDYSGRYYHKAQNLSRKLSASYDEALSSFDLLLMPTAPFVARPHPSVQADDGHSASLDTSMTLNCAPFDCTGHPAMSIPCAMHDGLPIGMMLIGRHYDEATIYRAAHAFESSTDWHER
jgi:amidase